MFAVDTNVLVHAANDKSPYHNACGRLLREAMRSAAAWYLTWGVCYEFLRVVTHPKVLARPFTGGEGLAFLAALRTSPSLGMLTPTERHADVLAEVHDLVPNVTGNLWHDAETATLMREHGIRQIYTRDTDFRRFPFIEAIDPVGASR